MLLTELLHPGILNVDGGDDFDLYEFTLGADGSISEPLGMPFSGPEFGEGDPQLAPLLPRHAQLVESAPKRLAGLPQTAIVVQRAGECQQQLGTRDPDIDQPDRRLQVLHGPAPTGDRLGVPQFREHGRTGHWRRRLPQGPLQVLLHFAHREEMA